MRSFIFTILFAFIYACTPAFALVGKGMNGTDDYIDKIRVPNSQLTKLEDKQYLVETGNYNWVKNPGFESKNGIDGWSGVLSTSVLSSVTSGQKFGKKAAKIEISAGYVDHAVAFSDVYTPATDNEGSNLAATIWIKVPALGYSFCAYRQSSSLDVEQKSCTPINVTGRYAKVYANIVGGDETKKYSAEIIGVQNTVVGGHEIYMDEFTIGPADNVGTTILPSEYSANISGAGVITGITPVGSGWLASCTNAADRACLYKSGMFTAPLNCTVSVSGGAGSRPYYARTYNSTSAGMNIEATYDTTTAANVTVKCNRTGADIPVNVVRNENANFTDKPWVSTISGLGSGSATLIYATYSRFGPSGRFCVRFNKDAVAGSGATNITMTLPPGITADVSKLGASQIHIGDGLSNINANNAALGASATELVFYSGGSRVNGVGFLANTFILGCVDVPQVIENGVPWQQSQGVYQLNGSYNSASPNSIKKESVIVGNSATAVCNTNPCGLSNPTSSFVTFARSGPGAYTGTFATGTWNGDNYRCKATVNQTSGTAGQLGICYTSSRSQTTYVLSCQGTGGAIDTNFLFECEGPQ